MLQNNPYYRRYLQKAFKEKILLKESNRRILISLYYIIATAVVYFLYGTVFTLLIFIVFVLNIVITLIETYRIRKGFYGNNEYEARQVISIVSKHNRIKEEVSRRKFARKNWLQKAIIIGTWSIASLTSIVGAFFLYNVVAAYLGIPIWAIFVPLITVFFWFLIKNK